MRDDLSFSISVSCDSKCTKLVASTGFKFQIDSYYYANDEIYQSEEQSELVPFGYHI